MPVPATGEWQTIHIQENRQICNELGIIMGAGELYRLKRAANPLRKMARRCCHCRYKNGPRYGSPRGHHLSEQSVLKKIPLCLTRSSNQRVYVEIFSKLYTSLVYTSCGGDVYFVWRQKIVQENDAKSTTFYPVRDKSTWVRFLRPPSLGLQRTPHCLLWDCCLYIL